ncbi:MAG: hypothetical protein LBQ22_03530 [Bacteroidales bacterium]|jgi:hypothetical protein|nr:hypothetical protein [Bacteroidales bacterium]
MTWTELQTFLKGKVFLIGLTFIDQDENLIEQYQTSGTVDELTDDGLLRFKRTDGNYFQLPYDNETISEVAEGEYRERATGNIIINPDYITTWKIQVNQTDNIENMKQNGYTFSG